MYATLLGSPSRSERNDDLESLLVWGLSRFRVVPVVQPRRIYASVAVGYGKAPLGLVAAKPLRAVVRIDRTLTETVVAAAGLSAARAGWGRSGARRDSIGIPRCGDTRPRGFADD